MKFLIRLLITTMCCLPVAASAQTFTQGTIIRPAVGPFGSGLVDPHLASQSMFATDLGFPGKWTDGTSNYLGFYFGDSWSAVDGTPFPASGSMNDDFVGLVNLANYPGGAYVETQNAGENLTNVDVFRRTHIPMTMRSGASAVKTIRVMLNTGTDAAPVWTNVTMEAGRTPTAMFKTNSKTVGGVLYPQQTFGFFTRYEQAACSTSSDCNTNGTTGLTCDTSMGLEQLATFNLYRACVGTTSPFTAASIFPFTSVTVWDESFLPHTCQPVSNIYSGKAGLCRDTSSPMIGGAFGGTYDDKVLSTAVVIYVGVRGDNDTTNYDTFYARKWITARFHNFATATVRDFVVGSATTATLDPIEPYDGDVYTTLQPKVFFFGRPNFSGKTGNGRNRIPKLYAGYANLPRATPSGTAKYVFTWAPQFLLTTANGNYPAASWTSVETSALALANTNAPTDNYNQISITNDQGHWLMLQGGDSPDMFLLVSTLGGYNVTRNTTNAIVVKASTGALPWTWNAANFNVLVEGDPTGAVVPAAGTQFAAGGILHHDSCVAGGGKTCVANTSGTYNLEVVAGSPNPNSGRLYGAIFIPQWIRTDTSVSPSVNVHYFMVSTWNPYGVFIGKFTYRP